MKPPERSKIKHWVVFNDDYGGFSISRECAQFMASRGCQESQELFDRKLGDDIWLGQLHSDFPRHNPLLVLAVKELGSERASGSMARLKLHELRGEVYYIDEYDGAESVVEPHTMQWVTIK